MKRSDHRRGLLVIVGVMASAGFADGKRVCEQPLEQGEPPPARTVPEGALMPAGAFARLGSSRQGCVNALAFSPDGKTLAAACADHRVHLWETATGKELSNFQGHSDAVNTLAFAPDGKSLVSGSSDDTLRRWDVATGKELFQAQGGDRAICSVAFSPDGKTVATGNSDHNIHLWDAVSGKPAGMLFGHESWVFSVPFSPDGKTLASCAGDHTLRLWNVAAGVQRCILQTHAVNVTSAAFSPDGKLLASGTEDDLLCLWEVATGQEIARWHGNAAAAISRPVAFSPDGRFLASGSADKLVRLFEVSGLRELFKLEGHLEGVRAVAFSPDGRFLASGGADASVLLWDLKKAGAVKACEKKPLAAGDLESSWAQLGGEDAAKAYPAVWALAAAGDEALGCVKRHLLPVRTDAVRIARLIAELDHDQYQVREAACEELRKIGRAVEPDLRRTVQNPSSPEVQERVREILQALDAAESEALSGEELRLVRAVHVLELIGTRGAREVLEQMGTRTLESRAAHAARESLARLEKLGGRAK